MALSGLPRKSATRALRQGYKHGRERRGRKWVYTGGVVAALAGADGFYLPLKTARNVVGVLDEAERLNRLVGNLLNMTRLESGAMRITTEVQDVEDLVGVALAQLGPRLQDRRVVVDIPAELPLVPMDFVLMAQVFINLLDNALKYTPRGTPITIRARTSAEELVVEVSDEGPGIPEDKLTRIFDKFYRVQERNSVGGTGLGLSISRGIVEAHGGRIWAENRRGGGAVFTVSLPLAPETVRPGAEVSR